MALDFNMQQQGWRVGAAGSPAVTQQAGMQGAMQTTSMPRAVSGTTQVMSSLDQVLGANSPYLANARRRGAEVAATRGGINSSIAAGSSERSALEAAAPFAAQGVAIDQQAQQVRYNEWQSQQNFGRNLFDKQFNSSLDMLGQIQQYAIEDPELYTPEVTSGFSNFFQQNMNDILKRYFGAPKPTV